ncbi:phosphohistidine phosphatase SixA [Thiohalocapsa marina]|uniref:phosphohistidine phosphatase SixA n=1 Tax=Thiohalocapsa marina TaxID=424902 RepID=UPI0036DD5749
MRIYLTQHGEALPKDLDPQRPLSKQGRADVQRLATFLRQSGIRVERVLHSGKLRAEQTAALLAETLQTNAPEAQSGLAPADPVEPLASSLADAPGDLLIVGHLPFLGRLVGYLLAADTERPLVDFKPSSMACLERAPDGHWMLVWMIRPELLVAPPANP